VDEIRIHEVLEGCKRLIRENLEHAQDHRPCETGARAQLARSVFAGLTGECLDCIMGLEHRCVGADFWQLRAEPRRITMHVVEQFEPIDGFSDIWSTGD
jgi:hypothetical protein